VPVDDDADGPAARLAVAIDKVGQDIHRHPGGFTCMKWNEDHLIAFRITPSIRPAESLLYSRTTTSAGEIGSGFSKPCVLSGTWVTLNSGRIICYP